VCTIEYDFKDIAIKSIVASVIAFIIGLILAYFDVGVLSFLIPVVIVGLVIGFFEDSIDSALVVGGVAGLIVSILHVTIPPFVLPPQIANLFEFSVLGYIFACALPAGVIALIKDIKC